MSSGEVTETKQKKMRTINLRRVVIAIKKLLNFISNNNNSAGVY